MYVPVMPGLFPAFGTKTHTFKMIEMMKYRSVFSILLFVWGFGIALHAQEGNTDTKEKLNAALKSYIVNLEPDNNCECNECKHTYKGGYKITKSQTVEGVLRLYGVAAVTYKSLYKGGEGTVQFYAELEKHGDDIVVTKLKWRKGECMRYETLLGTDVGG
jgi:hypothetical protein